MSNKIPRVISSIVIALLIFLTFSNITYANNLSEKESKSDFFENLQNEDVGVDPESSSTNTASMLVKTVFYLVIILAIFYLIMKYLSKFKALKSNSKIIVLGGTNVGPNKSLKVVKVGTSAYILGVGENVTLLDKIVDIDEIEYIAEETETSEKLPNIFKIFGKKEESNSTFSQVFRNRIISNGEKKTVQELIEEEKGRTGHEK